ncbi:MAG: ABC transporter permease [Paramuribaculum sp.]|nr:ABC transporter permease [Paramuribaculum sp.]
MNNIFLVIRREFLERVQKKSFIITTILMPLFMIALMAAPALIMTFSTGGSKTIYVIDETKNMASLLKNDEETKFVEINMPLDSALKSEELNTVLFLPANLMTGGSNVTLFSDEASSMKVESLIRSQLNNIIENERLTKYDIQNLDKILEEVHSDVTIQSFRTDREDSAGSSTVLSYALGMLLTFLLYMCLLLYGQMVMTSIIEEKNNRVLEIVVSSVKPTHLMTGKICGIGLVALTQIVIWGILIAVMSAFVLPLLIPEAVSGEMASLNAGQLDPATASVDVDMLKAMSLMSDVSYIISLFGMLILFLIGGFMLYAAIYAAIGSAVDNIQDAGQLQSFVIFPIIIGIIFGMAAANDPNSSVAFILSFIPFTAPMVMMARIPSAIPSWEIWVSLAILYLSFFGMIWVAAKIYRVGIFMYGKKPNIKDLIRWARYK